MRKMLGQGGNQPSSGDIASQGLNVGEDQPASAVRYALRVREHHYGKLHEAGLHDHWPMVSEAYPGRKTPKSAENRGGEVCGYANGGRGQPRPSWPLPPALLSLTRMSLHALPKIAD